jgi:hypothetical protein
MERPYAVIVLTGRRYTGVARRFRTLQGAAEYTQTFNELFGGRMTATVLPHPVRRITDRARSISRSA